MDKGTDIVTIDLGERSYDIYIGSGLLHRLSDFMPFDLTARSVFIITDQNVKPYAENAKAALQDTGAAQINILSLPAGEQTKSFNHVRKVMDWLLSHKVNRDSVIFAVGGGVIGDLAGFCASIILRGIPYIQIPTTLLSQVDSAVGGKTGINTENGKNLVGSFYQPVTVIIDTDTLNTLPDRQIKAGYAEIVKYGLIKDISFFEWLEKNGENVCNLNKTALNYAIETSVQSKANIVQNDEKETGWRALLNLGHTFGHALEAAAHYDGRLLHGEAVAMGIVMAFDMSYRMNLCTAEDFMRVENHFQGHGLLTRASYINPPLDTSVKSLYESMQQDKKVSGGVLNLILVRGIGEAFITKDYPDDLIKDTLKQSLGGETSGKGDKVGKQWMKNQWTSIFSSR